MRTSSRPRKPSRRTHLNEKGGQSREGSYFCELGDRGGGNTIFVSRRGSVFCCSIQRFLSSSDGYFLCHICTGQSIQRRYSATILPGEGEGHTRARNSAKSGLVLSNLLHISSYHHQSSTSLFLSTCSGFLPSLSQLNLPLVACLPGISRVMTAFLAARNVRLE